MGQLILIILTSRTSMSELTSEILCGFGSGNPCCNFAKIQNKCEITGHWHGRFGKLFSNRLTKNFLIIYPSTLPGSVSLILSDISLAFC